MTSFVLERSEPRLLLCHLAFYGLAAILENAGHDDLRLSWTPGMAPRPVLSGEGLDPERLGQAVHEHATVRAAKGAWPSERAVVGGKPRGLMSPRLSTLIDAEWEGFQARRHAVLDSLTAAGDGLDLRLIAALGEPSYWRANRKGERLQDDGASRLEMQPRNQGSEWVANRLHPIAQAVADRTVDGVVAGLTGKATVDEVGANRPDSRSATGFGPPGPVDNAVVWCALWGISQFPIAQRLAGAATTTGHVGRTGAGWFYLPVWTGSWRPARLRTVLASKPLRQYAASGLPDETAATAPLVADPARLWLSARSVSAVIRFPVRRFGSDSAPERRAQLGEILHTGSRP
jgi:CRISPR-associated protein Csb3